MFFEVDPIGACGFREFINWYSEESPYYTAERYRNALRRVCSSWNVYLLRFNYRYVDLDDVQRGSIPIMAISQAIRLVYRPFEDGPKAQMELVKRCLSEGSGYWPLEILDGGIVQIDGLFFNSGRIPEIRSIRCTTRFLDHEGFASLAPKLTFFDASIQDPYVVYDLPPINTSIHNLKVSQLTSLVICLDQFNLLLPSEFPGLKHLSISPSYYLFSEPYISPEEMTVILKQVGKNLVTFSDTSDSSALYYGSNGSILYIPSEIWELCPNLIWFCTVFTGRPTLHYRPYYGICEHQTTPFA